MKAKIIIFPVLLLAAGLLSFAAKEKIARCFIAFAGTDQLTAASPDRLPETSEKLRTLTTDHGEITVTRIDGYRVLYNNNKQVPFVNLKVELSEKGAYEKDQQGILENLRYLTANSKGMESKDLIETEFNGYKVYGLSRESIEEGSVLGTFVMFPGDGVTIYFYFNNLKPGYRNFESAEDYRKQRDAFMDAYTKHLANCKDK